MNASTHVTMWIARLSRQTSKPLSSQLASRHIYTYLGLQGVCRDGPLPCFTGNAICCNSALLPSMQALHHQRNLSCSHCDSMTASKQQAKTHQNKSVQKHNRVSKTTRKTHQLHIAAAFTPTHFCASHNCPGWLLDRQVRGERGRTRRTRTGSRNTLDGTQAPTRPPPGAAAHPAPLPLAH